MFKVMGRVLLGMVIGSIVLVAMAFAYAVDLIDTTSSFRDAG
jgi:hypothetical protein